MTKLQRAIKLRDLALPVVVKRGAWETTEGASVAHVNVLSYRDSGFAIFYRMPSQSIPQSSDSTVVPQKAANGNLPYGLDIWFGEKVLNIEWADDGTVELRDYKPGRSWERRLSKVSARGAQKITS